MKFAQSMQKAVLVFVAATVVCSSAARRQEEVTLVMVPRDDATVQLGLDIANTYPTLLVSYKLGANGTASLHGWTGTQWVNIATDDFRAGNFFRTGPDSALIVEAPGAPLPETLMPPADWCPSVSKIATTEMRPLIHLVGQYFDFPFKDWQWFAKRYNMDLDAINPEGLNVAWYNKPLSDHFKSAAPVGASDLQYWFSIRQPIVGMSMLAEPIPLEEASEPAMEEPVPTGEGDDVGNPLTNAVPPAVVLGAADVPEEVVAEPVVLPPQTEAPSDAGGL